MFLLVAVYIPPSKWMFGYMVDHIPFPEPKTKAMVNILFFPLLLFITVASMLWPVTTVVVATGAGIRGLKVRKAKRLQQIDDDFNEVIRLIYD